MKKFLLITALLVLAFSTGCRSLLGRGDKGGIKGDDPYVTWAKESVDLVIVEFREMYGLELVWKWDEWDLLIREVPANSSLKDGNGKESIAITNYDGTLIHQKAGTGRSTTIEEIGHAILARNGIKKEDAEFHHKKFPKFFGKYG